MYDSQCSQLTSVLTVFIMISLITLLADAEVLEDVTGDFFVGDMADYLAKVIEALTEVFGDEVT